MNPEFRLTVFAGTESHTLTVPAGTNLRKALLNAGLSPYAALTRKLNCGGRGLCATCGVWITDQEPAPRHWHDKLAKRFGYSRLSCQITIESDMVIQLDQSKKIWGKPKRNR